MQVIDHSTISSNPEQKMPVVYNYTNYRKFLKDGYDYLKSKNASFSETAFIKKAGYGSNSRGYFTLILNGKRNLSSKTILGFASALKLEKKQVEFFEALVLFNQAKTNDDKEYYLEKIKKLIKGKETKAFRLLRAHFNLCSKWYLIAIRELISLEDFINHPEWIAKRLRDKVSPKEVAVAIEDLKNLGLVKEKKGDLYQISDFLSLDDEIANDQVITNYHKQMMDKSKEYLDEDPYKARSASTITFTCNQEDFNKIREEVAAFGEDIINKYGLDESSKKDTLLHMGFQILHLTTPKITGRK